MKTCNAVAWVAASVLLLGGCAAHTPAEENWPGYRTDGEGRLLKTADGRCWRTADWTADKAVPECDVAITGVPVVEEQDTPPPTPPAPAPVVPAMLRVTFAFDSAVLTEASRVALKAWYQDVARLAQPVVTIDGFSDPLGEAGYNRTLAEQRAQCACGDS